MTASAAQRVVNKVDDTEDGGSLDGDIDPIHMKSMNFYGSVLLPEKDSTRWVSWGEYLRMGMMDAWHLASASGQLEASTSLPNLTLHTARVSPHARTHSR
jgi:hypothetical protein